MGYVRLVRLGAWYALLLVPVPSVAHHSCYGMGCVGAAAQRDTNPYTKDQFSHAGPRISAIFSLTTSAWITARSGTTIIPIFAACARMDVYPAQALLLATSAFPDSSYLMAFVIVPAPQSHMPTPSLRNAFLAQLIAPTAYRLRPVQPVSLLMSSTL